MLDDDQKRVVAHETGPAVILAGAGSGKTRCTAERARRRLVESGVPSDGLILLTFTNKAAGRCASGCASACRPASSRPGSAPSTASATGCCAPMARPSACPATPRRWTPTMPSACSTPCWPGGFPERPERLAALRLREAVAAHGLDVEEEADEPVIAALWESAGWRAARARSRWG